MTSTNNFPTFTTMTPQTTDKWLTNILHTATSTYTQQTSIPQTDVTLTQTNLPAPNWTDITADIIFKKNRSAMHTCGSLRTSINYSYKSQKLWKRTFSGPSSETQGQLVGTREVSAHFFFCLLFDSSRSHY